jgi:hypothetical protein
MNTIMRVLEIRTTNEATIVVMKRQEPNIEPMDM